MSKDIDIGAISEALNDKADRDFGNTEVPNIAQADYVVAWGGGNEKWYRLWKSGWLEQGGYTNYPSGWGTDITNPKTFSFMKAFNSKPNFKLTPIRILGGHGYDIVTDVSTSYFKFLCNSSSGNFQNYLRGIYWKAEGWAAENS